MAFELLTERLQSIVKNISGKGKLTDANIKDMLNEVRLALIEADVNISVVNKFVNDLRLRVLGAKVNISLTPDQMVVKLVHQELVKLLGEGQTSEIRFEINRPTVIMLVGLQGSGKTTAIAKLAALLRKKYKKSCLMGALDIYRPGAIDQLSQLAKSIDIPLHEEGVDVDPVEVAANAYKKAVEEKKDVVLLDTAGRLHIDDKLMQELVNISNKVKPTEILLVVDAMSGQDAINVINSFNKTLPLTGIIVSKLDGDARGGVALSARYLTKLPIKFASVGEKINDIEIFYPDRMARRILGMGDILDLVERVQDNIDEKRARKSINRMLDGKFDLEDMLDQMEQINKLGSLGSIMKLIPGVPKLSKEQQEHAEKRMKLTRIIISSMTKEERKHPELIKASRKQRIAKGSGTHVSDVNKVLRQFEQQKEMMKKMSGFMKGGKLPPNMFG
ncbi:TPA: signal recognition particle protein [bacterium]|jgi:signal recognition particle subunit SRP54|nr:signal recognition particle protein [bacterium]